MLRTRVKAGPVAGIVLAIVLAAILTVVHSVELLVPRWRLHEGYPARVTLRLPTTTGLSAARPAGSVAPGASTSDAPRGGFQLRTHRVIVARTNVPRGEVGQLVEAYEQLRRPLHWRFAVGLFSIYLLTSALFFTYLQRFGPTGGRLLRTQIGLFALVVALAVTSKAALLFTPLSEFYIPVAVVPLWVALYIDRRTALLFNLALAFLISSFAGFDATLLAVFLARGMSSTMLFRDRKHPRAMVLAGAIGGLAGALMLIACRFYLVGDFDIAQDLRAGYQGEIAACVAGGVVAGLLGWLAQQPVGLVLGAVSRAQLIDLCDLDQPLLKKMAAEAPGSWQHARAMANLAEDAAAAIHADAMLTRAGAYYHDLGKTIQCEYFVENLGAGQRSPHEDLEPDVSADVIMSHVVGGTKILRDAGIPEPVVEFAYTHHGTSVIEFFWHKCQQQGNPKGLTEDAFRYPGMKPHTKETAILMLIDAIEAASRTIDPPDRARFEEMIQRVIFSKMKQGQLDESGLTVEDLRVLITSIAETLVKVYHHRIKYPWQNKAEAAGATPNAASPSAPASAPEPAAPVVEASGPVAALPASDGAGAHADAAADVAENPSAEPSVEVVTEPANDVPEGEGSGGAETASR